MLLRKLYNFDFHPHDDR